MYLWDTVVYAKWIKDIEGVLVLSSCVGIHRDSKSHPPMLISLHTVYDTFSRRLCPCVSRWWGEPGLSVTCPHSELCPFSYFCGSPVPILLTSKSLSSTLCPSRFSAFDLYFQCSFLPLILVVSFHISAPSAQLEQVKASSRWCPNSNSCSLLLDTHMHTLDTYY